MEKSVAAEFFECEHHRFLGGIYAGEGKCRVECESVLPDYKEAAHRILRVDTKTRINSKNTYLKGQVAVCEVEGVATFHILYVPDRGGEDAPPSAMICQENFSHTFNIPTDEKQGDLENLLARLELHPENTSGKLLGPRKLSLRCEVVLSLDLKSNRDLEYYTGALPEHIMTLKKEREIASFLTEHREDISFRETIRLPAGYQPILEICQMDVDLFALETVPKEGGVSIKGSCDIHCCYIAEDESFVSFYQPIEFERSVGIPLCEEKCLCNVIFTPDFLKANPEINEDGENKNIAFELGCTAEITLFLNEKVLVVEDAFSTLYDLEKTVHEHHTEKILTLEPFCVAQRCETPLEEKGIRRAEGVRSYLEWKDSYPEDGKIAVEGKAVFRYLGITEEGAFRACESVHPFKFTLPFDNELLERGECRIELFGGVRGAEPVPSEDKLFIRYDICGTICLYRKESFKAISQMSLGEKAEKEEACLLFYYPEKGERVWELSKRFRISPQRLCEENAITDEVLPSCIKIIL
jgi:hypothetical protein